MKRHRGHGSGVFVAEKREFFFAKGFSRADEHLAGVPDFANLIDAASGDNLFLKSPLPVIPQRRSET